ncbi:MAG: polysaccharide deacetylase family protein [Pseudomonadota bacterium]|nr:polysaccharide deacetylase family protein [Pseudomonadota bacterium]MDL2354153.1 polysaccharide deacetylase family protein [Pseudomonadota bacterium]
MLIARSSPPAVPAPGANAALASLACQALARAVSLSPLRKRLSILIYHRVLAAPDPLFPAEVDAQRFEQHLRYLKRSFNVISLSEAVHGLRHDSLPPRAACITFDDGYADNAEIALPLLQRHALPATFFVATGFLDGGRMFNDTVIELVRRAPAQLDLTPLQLGRYTLDSWGSRRQAVGALLDQLKYLPLAEREDKIAALTELVGIALPDDLMMRTDQLRRLHAAGMEIGGHTVSHPILARMSAAGARDEIAAGKAQLEQLIGAPVRLFAYPNGIPGQDYQAEHVDIVRSLGFDAAVCTSWGAARPGGDLFQLPRFTPWNQDQLRFTVRLMQNLARRGNTV